MGKKVEMDRAREHARWIAGEWDEKVRIEAENASSRGFKKIVAIPDDAGNDARSEIIETLDGYIEQLDANLDEFDRRVDKAASLAAVENAVNWFEDCCKAAVDELKALFPDA